MFKIGDLISVINVHPRRGPPRRLAFVTKLLPIGHAHYDLGDGGPAEEPVWSEHILVITYLNPYVSWNGTLVTQHELFDQDSGINLVSRAEGKRKDKCTL